MQLWGVGDSGQTAEMSKAFFHDVWKKFKLCLVTLEGHPQVQPTMTEVRLEEPKR